MAVRLTAIAPPGLLAAGGGLLAAPAGLSVAAPMLGTKAAAAGAPAAMLADESMVNMVNIEGQLRASSIRRLTEMVEKHPEESLSIMRGWLTQEAR
jgi:flagellar M-ring protein FliF